MEQVVNPLVKAADPFILRDADRYLLLATTGKNITVWADATIAGLGAHPHVVWTPADDMTEVWSPTLWKLNGTWWIYFTAKYPSGKHSVYALQADTPDPLGVYTLRGRVELGHEAIDPSILTVAGKPYLMYVDVDPGGWNAVWMTALRAPTAPTGPNRQLIFPDKVWERGGGTDKNYPVAEGPTALYHGGKTFVVYSGSDTGTPVYCLGLLTYGGTGDPTLADNWRKSGPVFQYSEAHGVYGPGRGTFTTSPDGRQSWLVYHAKDTGEYTYAHRTVRAQPFTWTSDGVPAFGSPVAAGPVATGPLP